MLPFGSSLSISIRMLEEPTMWWFAALLVLARLFDAGHHRQVDRRPQTAGPTHARPSSKQ